MTSTEPETPLFNALLCHFRDAGCCVTCAPHAAIVATEKAFGRSGSDVEKPNCVDKMKRCGEWARAAWKTRPRAEQPAQARRAA